MNVNDFIVFVNLLNEEDVIDDKVAMRLRERFIEIKSIEGQREVEEHDRIMDELRWDRR